MLTFKQKLSLCWRILREGQTNSLKHAERELAATRATGDEMNCLMADHLEEMVLVFATQGHSGFSARYAVQALGRLLDFKPLGPLTGEDDEWNEVGEGVFQNRRCSEVFKGTDGRPYTIHGYVFEEPSGARFSGKGSRKYIAFPYTPTDPEIVEVDEHGKPLLKKYAGLRD